MCEARPHSVELGRMAADHDAYFEEVEARFENALDFDLGLEEEFHVLDPETLELTPGFEALREAAGERLRERIADELLRSEIEVSTPRTLHFGQAAKQLLLNRAELFALADREGYALGATGTHPFSAWKDQQIIDTPHYRLVEDKLKYVAWRNNTWAAHVHVGVRGCDRAVAVCDALRTYLPHLLALSANSPFIEGVWTQLHSARTPTFVRMFPRCGIPDVFGTWAECSWVHTPSMNGELADRASRCGRYVRSASQTATARSQPRTPTCTCAAQVLLRQATYLSLSSTRR